MANNFLTRLASLLVSTLAGIALLALDTAAGHAIDIQLLDRTAAKPATYHARMLLETNAFSLDTTSLQGKPSAMLCRRDDAVYLLDHAAKRYVSVDLQTLSGASSMMRGAGAWLESSGLGGMLPEQKAGGPIVVEATDKHRKIGNLPCQLYVLTRGGVKVQEVWATPWTAVAMPQKKFDLIKSVAASWSSLAPLLGATGTQAPVIPVDALLKIDAYPVLFSQFANGRPTYEGRFCAPKSAEINPADFIVPTTYKRTALPSSGAP